MRSNGSLFIPAFALVLIAAAVLVKPWSLFSNQDSSVTALSYTQPGQTVISHDDGKLSAAALERIIYRGSLHWAPNHPLRMKCAPDTHGSWDYLCTDAYLREVWGYDVGPWQVTNADLVEHAGRRISPP